MGRVDRRALRGRPRGDPRGARRRARRGRPRRRPHPVDELDDNADGARGLASAQLWVGAAALLYDGARGVALSGPLASRVLAPTTASEELPPPHRPLVDRSALAGWRAPATLPIPLPAVRGVAAWLRAILRAAHGLPPIDPDVGLSVGHEHIDATIDGLLRHASLESSVFALVAGA